MPLFNHQILMGYLRNFRIVHLAGRYGGGKTALAFRLAYELLSSGDFRWCLSNIPCVFADDPSRVDVRDGRVDAVVVLDEGGIFLKTTYDIDKFIAYLRKLNIVLLIPSVLPPSSRATFLSIERIFNGWSLGLPVWFYGYTLRYGRAAFNGWFAWWGPHEIFGLYNTLAYPEDDGGLSHYFVRWVDEARRQIEGASSREVSVSALGEAPIAADASGVSVLDALGRLSATLDELASSNSVSVSLLASELQGNRRRKRGRGH